ncbi:acylglycerol kinase family protein [Candidatus Hydrogenedentota bacterium]
MWSAHGDTRRSRLTLCGDKREGLCANNTLYIINPTSHGGAGARAWEAFQHSWRDPINPAHVVFTERPEHAREIATSVKGYDTITAVGGDGTVGEHA